MENNNIFKEKKKTPLVQGCMQKFCKGGGGKLGVFKKEGAQLQAALGGTPEDNVIKLVW